MASVQRGTYRPRILLAVLGTAVSLLLVISVFFTLRLPGHGPVLTPRFSLREFAHDLPRHLPYLVLFTFLSALMTPLRAVQWQFTLRKSVPFWDRFHLVAVGALAHNVLPGKMGDVTRAFLLARKEGIPFVESLGSVAVCKLLELLVQLLLTALVLLGPMSDAMGPFARSLRIAGAIGAGLAIFTLLLARYSAELSTALQRRGTWPRVQRFLQNASAGLSALRGFKPLMVALAWSAGPVIAPALGYGIWLQALGVPGGIFGGMVVVAAITLGQSTLGMAAATGTSFAVAAWAARVLGLGWQDAAAFSTLTAFGTMISQTVPGAVSLLKRKVRWSEIRRGRERELDAKIEREPMQAG